MKIIKRVKNNTVIIAIIGELDLNTVPAAKMVLDSEINSHHEQLSLVFDLKELEYIDSSGLGVFINIAGKIRAMKGTYMLMGLLPKIRRIFDLTKLSFFFKIVRDEAELDLISAATSRLAPDAEKKLAPPAHPGATVPGNRLEASQPAGILAGARLEPSRSADPVT